MNTNTKTNTKDIFDKLEDFGQSIDKRLRSVGHRKQIKKIKDGLMSNPQLLIKAKNSFEKAFGVNSATRSPQQWTRLVNTYGYETVMKTEKMTREEIEIKMAETFTSKVRSII